MSNEHLSDLKTALERSHWCVVAELPGNDYDVAAVWKIERPDGSRPLHIEFAGLDDMNTLPIERAYGIKAREAPDVAAHLARLSRTWPLELGQFINNLERLAQNKPLKSDAREIMRAPERQR